MKIPKAGYSDIFSETKNKSVVQNTNSYSVHYSCCRVCSFLHIQ